MARINNDGQWIVMLGFIISIILVFLALIVNQSALVGKTTSESVLEFPKSEIQDLRAEIMEYYWTDDLNNPYFLPDLHRLSLERKGSVVYYVPGERIEIHYNNGFTEYNEKTLGGN
ncbi:MAG TPA: hypothetical protein PLU94_02345 [Methanoregulaceae archaeon]|nr:hypothetical protein [Methanoregulaceae archaeon]HPM62065.1 hypothetical protein [Methanoregulaceae archaeon]